MKVEVDINIDEALEEADTEHIIEVLKDRQLDQKNKRKLLLWLIEGSSLEEQLYEAGIITLRDIATNRFADLPELEFA